ncbi:AzlC family ABC transporter permease [Candidatus Gottesmanbacteria bacterium]|nr:AzlC family ABC transporter permease [Candidatus Gottesmanbacteria bacterium]
MAKEVRLTDDISNKKHFRNGVHASLPIVLGYIAIGLVVGVVAKTAGLTVLEVSLMSLLLYAGSAQLIVSSLIGVGASAPSIVFTIFLVNMRHLLYSASLAPHIRTLPLWQNILIGLELTDETFAVAANHLAGNRRAHAAWLFGLNLTAHATWIASTTIGAIAGRAIPNTHALGLDFALTAMFAALFVLQIASSSQMRVAITVGLVSAVVAVGGTLFVSSSWAIIVAAVMAASVGVLIERKLQWI